MYILHVYFYSVEYVDILHCKKSIDATGESLRFLIELQFFAQSCFQRNERSELPGFICTTWPFSSMLNSLYFLKTLECKWIYK